MKLSNLGGFFFPLFYHLCSKCFKYLNCLSPYFPNESLFVSGT